VDEQDRGVTAADVWEHGATALRSQLAANTWGLWFQGVRAIGLADGVLTLAVPSTLAADRIRSSYTGMLNDTLRDVTGQDLLVELTVETDTRSDEVPGPGPGPAFATDPGPATAALMVQDDKVSRTASGGLNPRYTFDQFVIGASNRFAHAAALSVAEAPARSYNPLFIYGGVGLGKTHLLHAIGHHVKAVFRNKRVRYVQTETFMNEFIDAIRTKTMPSFKSRYRDLDVLLIDDIQFLARTQELQEEFFHTFNQLHNEDGQIVISSDAPPKSIAPLEDRLRSRFEWGLITDVQVPEFETRLAILHKKAEAERLHAIPDDVLAFIATNIHDNVRELEGALLRISAYSSLHHEAVSEEIAHQVLADLISPAAPREITPQLILDETAKMFGWTVDDLCGKSRRRPLVTARQIGMYVFRELTQLSYPRIAEEFGGRDHTTVMYAVEKIKQQMNERHATFDQVNDLIGRIKLGTGG
jgi:chromosomal replication initiator protein